MSYNPCFRSVLSVIIFCKRVCFNAIIVKYYGVTSEHFLILNNRFYLFQYKCTICFLPWCKIIVFIIQQQRILIDIELIEECRGGNLQNFRKLVELTSPFAFSVAFRILGDEDQAKDVVQETMISIWQKLKKIRSADVYKTWIYRIVVNKCYDQLRRKKRSPEFVADEKAWKLISDRIAEETSSELENTELTKIIKLLTDRLSPKQKAVFVLSDIEQMSHDEISEITGISKSGIKSNLYYARKSISEMVEKYL